jgi:hypothetical protein
LPCRDRPVLRVDQLRKLDGDRGVPVLSVALVKVLRVAVSRRRSLRRDDDRPEADGLEGERHIGERSEGGRARRQTVQIVENRVAEPRARVVGRQVDVVADRAR